MPRLLIVDDDSVDRELAARCVADIPDLEVEEAEHGRQALEICAEGPPDLVLTDLRMPHLDGLALVQEMRQRYPLVPVILMTARGSEQVAVQALAAGAASYVPKAEMTTLLGEVVEQAVRIATDKAEQAELMKHLCSAEFRFELINDPALIAPLVSYLQEELERIGFTDEKVRSQLGTALYESLSNAMIHGNLEVDSDLRDEGNEPYLALIEERRAREPWSKRRVRCRAEYLPDRVRYVIRDEGAGFDRSLVPDPRQPESMLKVRGRGLFLMNAFMDEVEFNETGNEVRLTKRRPRTEPGEAESAGDP